ncbi:MAG: bifunctional riboflavin kinase/FAD synthetase [Rhodospirillales bacterium]|nr:bifunctional riboflavin kinase/FAD synthetase [Rhodospirillales bacterium]
MRIYRHYETLPDQARGAAIAIGNFDGVHKGHCQVINEAGLIARDAGIPWAVLTFEPHPRSVFQPGGEPFRLTPFRAKARALEALGVEVMIVQKFNRAFSQSPAEDFVKTVLADGFGAKHVVAGYDFVFGHGRKGNCELLLSLGQKLGFGFTAISAVESPDGFVYSSTRIRQCLETGDPRGAAEILGRPYVIEGRVAHGEKRGRTIGFPTANIHLGTLLRPRRGIYAVRARIEGDTPGQWVKGVANIGTRPTVNGVGDLLEVYLFDFDAEIYRSRLSVELIAFIRDEVKFESVEAMRREIVNDVTKAKAILQSE